VNVIKREFPEFAPLIQHLRDINTRRLDISLPALYGLLKRVPVLLPADEVEAFAAAEPAVANCVAGLNLDEHEFRPRDVALYGLAECERALLAGEVLDRGDAEALGRMMNISHDGDRVIACKPECGPFEHMATDEVIESLIARSAGMCSLAESGAALWQQPGSYGCSMSEMDLLVDRALARPEVLGAQLAGAGVGGCVMILVRSESVDLVTHALEDTYYEREGVAPLMFVCHPSHGSYVLTSVETQ
jgi:galactokinase